MSWLFRLHVWLLDRGILKRKNAGKTIFQDADSGEFVSVDPFRFGGSFVPGQGVICNSKSYVVIGEHVCRDDCIVTIRRG